MLPGPAVPGCCLISFHFLWAIHPIRPVLGFDFLGLLVHHLTSFYLPWFSWLPLPKPCSSVLLTELECVWFSNHWEKRASLIFERGSQLFCLASFPPSSLFPLHPTSKFYHPFVGNLSDVNLHEARGCQTWSVVNTYYGRVGIFNDSRFNIKGTKAVWNLRRHKSKSN